MNTLPRLILAKDLSRIGLTTRALSAQARSGKLVRIRHGVYVEAVRWNELQPWERYRLRVEAAAETFTSLTTFSHHSAAAISGMPVILRKQPIHALTAFSGGGRSSAGVRRHYVPEQAHNSEQLEGFLVTGRIRTVLDIAATVPFAEAVVPMDYVLKSDAVRGIDGGYSQAAVRRIRAVVDFADPQSCSPGESYSRGLIHVAGFASPVLQYEVRNGSARIAITDFYWEETRVAGEFDGREKYLKPEYLRGRTPSDVVYEEKVREDRIRATGRNVARWVWDELNSPGRLERILLDAGVPLRRRASGGHPNVSVTSKRAGDTRI
ncbi:type IV toxin-antitoxin system AbiEi family antitoxin domain-containing protein [Arthrobacter sp. 2MCAF14]|uniref:type IV toxin-antitoxin system AbiEi family antitoxin domain-containing protein n=1 Tax=Arthrobacter sp. 2MCAF14 TaxID=3232982 RepID=UPI003F911685